MNKAVDFAIKNNFLNGFFQKQKMEVLNMSLTEFDQEQYERQIRAEGFEDGHSEGISQGEHNKAVEAAKKLIQMHLGTLEQIAKCTTLSIAEVQALSETLEVKNTK